MAPFKNEKQVISPVILLALLMDRAMGYEMRGRIRHVPLERGLRGRNGGVKEVSAGFSGGFLADCQHESLINYSE